MMNVTVVFFLADYEDKDTWTEVFQEKNVDDPVHAVRRARNKLYPEDQSCVEHVLVLDSKQQFYLERAWW